MRTAPSACSSSVAAARSSSEGDRSAMAARSTARRTSSLEYDAVVPADASAAAAIASSLKPTSAAYRPMSRRRARLVGQRDLDGEVDPTGTLGEGPLEGLGAVGGQQEDHVGVLVEAVHGVEQREQQGRRAAAEVTVVAVLGDQVDVLEDDDRRLVGAGDLGRLRDVRHLGAGEQDDRGVRTRTDQVPDRVGLAGAGRAVEQDAALEVLAAPAELVAVRGELDDVAAHLGERALREDDPVGGQVGTPDERDRRPWTARRGCRRS